MSRKFLEYFRRMLEVEKELFKNFQVIHNNYALNPENHQEEFNKEGERVLQVISHWEAKLCRQSEIGGYSFSTPKLAEKFREEVRREFPEIDKVGIIIEKSPKNINKKGYEPSNDTPFFIKKITL